jgi:Ni/Co efflux regulator RcnB/surface antigen
MKRLMLSASALTLALLVGGSASAQPRPDYRDSLPYRQNYQQEIRGPVYYSKGDTLAQRYRQGEFVVKDLRGNNLRAAPRGSRWVRVSNQFVLVNLSNGKIRDVIRIEDRRDRDWGNARPNRDFPDRGPPPRIHDRADQEARWRQRYGNISIANDSYYKECRNKPDPAGVIIGAVLGGLLGNAAGGRNDSGGATVAGVFAGGAIGAMMSSNLDCDDRSYAYRTYHDGFNAGRENTRYEWKNPQRGDRRGELLVRDYYDDPDGFRCATYTQKIYVGGRPQEGSGRACRQPDGSWAMMD